MNIAIASAACQTETQIISRSQSYAHTSIRKLTWRSGYDSSVMLILSTEPALHTPRVGGRGRHAVRGPDSRAAFSSR
jgi:hypothetical protein